MADDASPNMREERASGTTREERASGTTEHDALRTELRQVLGLAALSLAAAAKLAGIAASTLSAWMAGKYAGDNDRVAADVRKWLDSRRAGARARSVLPPVLGFVLTETADRFLDTLEHAQYVVDMVVIAGGAGVGKTTAARRYASENPNVWLLTCEPSIGSTHAMLDYLCTALNVAERSSNKRAHAVQKRLTSSEGLLIVDEAQHLTTQALDQLRSIHDQAGVGIALIGNEEVYGRLDGGGRVAKFAQLTSRIGMKATRVRPTAKDVDALLDAYGVAGARERGLLRDVARRPGALRGMVKTLRLAHMLAAGAEAEAMTADHILAAKARLTRVDDAGDAP